MRQHFVFIASGEPVDASHARRLVRKTAMKSFRRNERMNRVARYAKSQTTIKTTASKGLQARGCGLDHDETASHLTGTACRRVDAQGVCTGVQSTVVEPCLRSLSATVLPVDEDVRKLLYHFINHIAPQLLAFGSPPSRNPIVTSFFPHAMQDPSSKAALLFHSGIHLDRLQRRSWSPTTLYYQGKTIRAVQEELTYLDSGVSIRCLTMVAFLAAVGNITGDVVADRTHKRALEIMVRACGGLGAISCTQASLALLLTT